MKKNKFVWVLWGLVLGLFMLIGNQVEAQQYYRQLDDASGLDNSEYQASLNEAAEALILSLPVEFQSQFRVYDFGFYLHQQQYTELGFPVVFQNKISEVERLSPYYLLFGKQSDNTGLYTKFWVDVKLPEGGNFPCVDETKRTIIGQQVTIMTTSTYESLGGEYYAYSQAEVAGIEKLRHYVEKILNCCEDGHCCDQGLRSMPSSCSTDFFGEDAMVNYLKHQGYLEFNCSEIEFIYDPIDIGSVNINLEFKVPISFDGMQYSYHWVSYTEELKGFINESPGTRAQLITPTQNLGSLNNNSLPDFSDKEYGEHVIAYENETKRRVFYKIFMPDSGNFNRSSSTIIPTAAVYLLKRAAMGGLNVMIDLAVETAFTKWIGCHDTWGEAWQNLQINYWGVFFSFVEGATYDKGGIQIAFALFKDLSIYLLSTPRSDLTWADAGVKMGISITSAFIFHALVPLVDRILPIIKKYSYLAFKEITGWELQVLVKFVGDVREIGWESLHGFLLRVKAWKVVSSDPNFSKVVANLEKIDGHLAKNIHTAEELETAFKAASDKAKWVDDIGFNVLRKPGRNAEYVNPNGKLLKWTEEANINAKIDDWLANTSGNKKLEAQVADVIRGQKPVEGLGIGVKRGNNSSAGDLDVYTKDELLEVKGGSGSINYNQLNKYVDDSLDDFLNPYGKKVILYIDQPMSSSVRQTVEGNLPSGVSLANSHSELLGLLN